MKKSDSIVLGGGCFWCLDAIYRLQPGVSKVVSGYAGGSVANPTYEQVCMGDTGHAEVIKIDFDPAITSLENILKLFWQAHDPTTINQQGQDIGSQYRSIILFNGPEQLEIIQKSLESVAQPQWGRVVTEIKPLENFYPAEDYHQDYFNKNPDQPYCQVVIAPKMKKLLQS